MINFKLIQVTVADGIAILTLNHPASRNGLSVPLQKEMLAALQQLAAHTEVGALILTGAGPVFCSGADLGQIERGAGASVGQSGTHMMETYSNPLMLALQNFPVPVLAAVNGAAAGAGMSLALAADIVLAARSAFFLMPFLPRLGIVPDLGATWFLPRLVGHARALGLMLLGDRLPAETARQWGLIWDCVDDALLMEEAKRIAMRLAQAPGHSALEARRALAAAAGNSFSAQLDYEKERQRTLLDLPAFNEGVTAFFEKRAPRFTRRAM